MSLSTFKKKSVINYGSKRSGNPTGGIWLPQGPFGHSTNGLQLAIHNPGYSGFSINGGSRSRGANIGKDMKMSKSGTPYRGTQPIGFGGNYGKYPSATLVGDSSSSNGIQTTGAISNFGSQQPPVQPVLNSNIVNTMGDQYLYIKPSVLSTYGMLAKKYRWAYNGKYPNYWVQPIYTGNQTSTASQGLYIQNLASTNTCNLKVNNIDTYTNHIVKCDSTCKKGRLYKYNHLNAPYTKTLSQPVSYNEYNLHITKSCTNPTASQKPFPYAVQTGTGIQSGGTSVTNIGNACNTSNTYLTPPLWYSN